MGNAIAGPNVWLVCRSCGDGHLVRPFGSAAERDEWMADHTRDTGHDWWRLADTIEELGQLVTILTLTPGN